MIFNNLNDVCKKMLLNSNMFNCDEWEDGETKKTYASYNFNSTISVLKNDNDTLYLKMHSNKLVNVTEMLQYQTDLMNIINFINIFNSSL